MKGILFKPYLLPAVMDGTKTMTRRMIDPQPEGPLLGKCTSSSVKEMIGSYTWAASGDNFYVPKPRYQPGEVVYVKEAWTDVYVSPVYKLDHKNDFRNPGWKSPMFMPKSAARTFLKITGVRAERICDISEADCIAEGVMFGEVSKKWDSPHKPFEWHNTPQEAFFSLFRYVNKGTPVDLNQWVWVYTFELTTKPDPA